MDNNLVGSCSILLWLFRCFFILLLFFFKDWLIWQRRNLRCSCYKTTSFTVQYIFLSKCCWICPFSVLSLLHSCTTIIMDLVLNVKSCFLFMHVEMTWLVFIPVFISLYWFMNGKKKIEKKAFVQPTESNFGILFDVYNNLWHYQQNYYTILLMCQSNM